MRQTERERERERERVRREGARVGELRKDTRGGVLYPLVGGLRFKATSSTHRNPCYATEHTGEGESEREIGERARAGGRSLFLLAAFIGGLSRCRGKKEAFAAVEARTKRVNARDSFSALILTARRSSRARFERSRGSSRSRTRFTRRRMR